LYADVWGPSPIPSVGYRYYVLFVDHFTKYCWFYPMHNKSNVSSIFVQFTTMVENQFSRKIKKIYSDNGGEFIKLRPILAARGISHFTTALHTPQQNGTVKRRHRHIVDTGMALLHHASAPSTYWTYALATTVYLINRLPTILHLRKSSFEVLFGWVPDYTKLRTFGCQCYPWLVPYRANKFQSKSHPCVFLGYSLTQHAFQCLNLHTGKIYLSHHVTFDESIFPFKLAPPSTDPSSATQCPASSPPSPVPPVCIVPLDTPITTPLVPDGAATVPPSPTPCMASSSPPNDSSSSVSPLLAAPALPG
jgi:histone deacetylase 1/2